MSTSIPAILSDAFPDMRIEEQLGCTPTTITLSAQDLLQVAGFLQADDRCYFDQLTCLTAQDDGVEAGTVRVVYHLNSIPHDCQVALEVIVPREKPIVPSITSIWRAANWHEREAYDLMGVLFDGHPDLRRILLPSDWVGHPLRKDYEEAPTYHGLSIPYDRDE